MGIGRWALFLAAVVALASACAGAGQVPQAAVSPVSSPAPASNPTKIIAGATATPTVAPEGDGAALLARAVDSLDRAKSYRFTVEAVYHWTAPGGQANDWTYTGQGEAIPPNRFHSVVSGPADSTFEVKMIDGKVTNTDARGPRRDASTAFGGPGIGAAPYTVISYLRNSTAQGQVQSASVNGTETRHLAFVPDLSKVSAMDASHKDLKDQVQAVQGSVWVDSKTGRVSQEAVTVQSKDSQGLAQTVTMTLKFTDYDAPVEIN